MEYKDAGVDIGAGEEAVERIKKLAHSTFRPEVLSGIGGFGGLFKPDLGGMKEPVLVAGCDGVGTKLKIAFASGVHDTVGIDCVAMCVNDILVQGAEPLFFLDYLAAGKLVPSEAEAIVSGIAAGCRRAGCALLGGEMAEMPGFYPAGEYDLAGFAVGIADREALVSGEKAKPGNALIGLLSSGLHSNGYSLARRVLLEEAALALSDYQPGLGCTLSEELLKPTEIYVRPVLSALKKFKISGMANITGGGLPGNLRRVLPPSVDALIDPLSWPCPPVFNLIASLGPVTQDEMFKVFNMGIGFVLAAAREEAAALLEHFKEAGVGARQVGELVPGRGAVRFTSADETSF